MKIIIGIIITLFSLPAYAALPDMITDPATRDVIEYLDALAMIGDEGRDSLR